MPRQEGLITLDTDASNFAIGAVLSQTQEDTERVIAYASRKLSRAEMNYCVSRRELLSIVYFVKYFRQYLLGVRFRIRTDHASLLWLRKIPEPIGQQARWLEILEEFDYFVEHRAGARHGNADGMSRIPCGKPRCCNEKCTKEVFAQPNVESEVCEETRRTSVETKFDNAPQMSVPDRTAGVFATTYCSTTAPPNSSSISQSIDEVVDASEDVTRRSFTDKEASATAAAFRTTEERRNRGLVSQASCNETKDGSCVLNVSETYEHAKVEVIESINLAAESERGDRHGDGRMVAELHDNQLKKRKIDEPPPHSRVSGTLDCGRVSLGVNGVVAVGKGNDSVCPSTVETVNAIPRLDSCLGRVGADGIVTVGEENGKVYPSTVNVSIAPECIVGPVGMVAVRVENCCVCLPTVYNGNTVSNANCEADRGEVNGPVVVGEENARVCLLTANAEKAVQNLDHDVGSLEDIGSVAAVAEKGIGSTAIADTNSAELIFSWLVTDCIPSSVADRPSFLLGSDVMSAEKKPTPI